MTSLACKGFFEVSSRIGFCIYLVIESILINVIVFKPKSTSASLLLSSITVSFIHGIERFEFLEILKDFGMDYYLEKGFSLISAVLFYTVSHYLNHLLKLYNVINIDSFDFLNHWDLVNLI